MKKLIAIAGILFLSGCSIGGYSIVKDQGNAQETEATETKPTEVQDDTFALKEKCSKYTQVEKKRFSDENPNISRSNPQIPIIDFEGIFYSKTLKSCIAKWHWKNVNGGESYLYEDVITYTDVLTGKSVKYFSFPVSNENPIGQKLHEILANDYEETLDLVK